MKVFEVDADIKYQSIITEERKQLLSLVSRLNNPIGDIKFPNFYVRNPKNEAGNFYSMGYELLAFDEVAHNTLLNEVEVAGENYTLKVDDIDTLHALNVTETCDALDHEKTVWREEDDGGKYKVLKYAFVPEKIVTNSGLFTMAENRYTRIFAVTGAPEQHGDFYSRYHEACLTGLRFTERWSRGT